MNKGSYLNPRKIALSALGNNQAEGTPTIVLAVTVNNRAKVIIPTAITNTSPVVVTTSNTFSNGQSIKFPIVPGITQLSNNTYFVGSVTSTSFSLYLDAGLTQPVNGTNMSPFIVNSISSSGTANSSTREVPVVFDPISGSWSDKLSRTNQEEREMGIEVANLSNDDQTFLTSVGYQQS